MHLQMILAPLSIFGGQDADEIAGSSAFIDDEELKKSGYTDTERIMERVPGVYSQTEDGLRSKNKHRYERCKSKSYY